MSDFERRLAVIESITTDIEATTAINPALANELYDKERREAFDLICRLERKFRNVASKSAAE